VLASLNRDGVAVTSAAALFGGSPSFDELCTEVARLQRALGDEIATARQDAGTPDIGKKDVPLAVFGQHPRARSAIHLRTLRTAADHATDCQCVLRYADTTALLQHLAQLRLASAAARVAALASGPGRLLHLESLRVPVRCRSWYRSFHLCPRDPPQGASPPRARIPPSRVTFGVPHRCADGCRCIRGPLGNLHGSTRHHVFADTRGYHKGGLTTERDRILYTCLFTSQPPRRRTSRASSDGLPRQRTGGSIRARLTEPAITHLGSRARDMADPREHGPRPFTAMEPSDEPLQHPRAPPVGIVEAEPLLDLVPRSPCSRFCAISLAAYDSDLPACRPPQRATVLVRVGGQSRRPRRVSRGWAYPTVR